jgi:hypothetical protein
MKPRDLTESNWDVSIAAFHSPSINARVTASADRMWFRVSAGHCVADITIPIKDFRQAVDFLSTFDLDTLKEEGATIGKRLSSYSIEIFTWVGSFKQRKIKYTKTPAEVLLRPWRQKQDHCILIRLSTFRKLIRWYNSDI